LAAKQKKPAHKPRPKSTAGAIIAVGGREDKEGDRRILREIATRAGNGKLVLATLASEMPDDQLRLYTSIFTTLGVKKVVALDFADREEAMENPKLEVIKDAEVMFFTGGDQMKLISKIAGTQTHREILSMHAKGCTIAGTSAGAAAMSATMLVGGPKAESHKVFSAFFTAPGLAILKDIIIDQHFAQRWRITRLLGAVAENPDLMGIGIDEDTAVILQEGRSLEVIGSGAVYVVDGSNVTYTNVSEKALERTMALFNVTLHVLKSGNTLNLKTRTPSVARAAAAETREDIEEADEEED
jgi:cyanophycinase